MDRQMVAIQRELKALRREVRRQRRRVWLIPAACVVALLALLPAAIGAAGFVDLPNPDQGHNADINAIANAGITRGCNPPANNAYCPYDFVTRQDMASFLARLGGLGGNPAVANAATVDGFYANGIVRGGVNSSGDTLLSVSTVYQNATAVTVSLPSAGFVLVTGAITFNAGNLNTNALASARVTDATAGFASYAISTSVGAYSATAYTQSVSPSTIFYANAGGTRTFGLQGGYAGVGPVQAHDATITALFFPFGPGGAFASETDGVNQSLDTPPPPRIPQP